MKLLTRAFSCFFVLFLFGEASTYDEGNENFLELLQRHLEVRKTQVSHHADLNPPKDDIRDEILVNILRALLTSARGQDQRNYESQARRRPFYRSWDLGDTDPAARATESTSTRAATTTTTIPNTPPKTTTTTTTAKPPSIGSLPSWLRDWLKNHGFGR